MDTDVVKLVLAFTQNVLHEAKAYTDEAVHAIISGMQYIGAVNYYADLANVTKQVGYVYTVKYQGDSGLDPDGTEYVWGEYEGTLQWIGLGPDIRNKADKINGGNLGNFVAIAADGNITDSGKGPTDFYTENDKGVPNGIAGLDQAGLVPASQLPVSCSVSDMQLNIATQII